MKKLLLLSILSLALTYYAAAHTNKNERAQRQPTGLFDYQWNTVSNFSFPLCNNGIAFLDIEENLGGGFWPRGSSYQYLFAGGFWFAAKKWIAADSLKSKDDTVHYRKLNKLCEIGYNPNSGVSWMFPGTVEDGDSVKTEKEKNTEFIFRPI